MTTYCDCLSHLLFHTKHRVNEVREYPSKGIRCNSYFFLAVLTPLIVIVVVVVVIILALVSYELKSHTSPREKPQSIINEESAPILTVSPLDMRWAVRFVREFGSVHGVLFASVPKVIRNFGLIRSNAQNCFEYATSESRSTAQGAHIPFLLASK